MILDKNLLSQIRQLDENFSGKDRGDYILPTFNPTDHYIRITDSKYFQSLLVLRHLIKKSSDFYFSNIQNAINIDLFMLTNSVSSPMGPGSDSEAISITLGKLQTFLTDSSQFGFEPILIGGIEKVYCYLPSMRGEDPDKRHLNQFFHCEAEIIGNLDDIIKLVEDYIKCLCETLLAMPNIIGLISLNPSKTKASLTEIVNLKTFKKISFDEAIQLLTQHGKKHLFKITDHGGDISSQGELELFKILNICEPLWITGYSRDRVPFYQKPDPNNSEKTLNADLLFPPLENGSFGGEVVGCGQRQNVPEEIYESLSRQNISSEPYEWYINLRRLQNYKTSSGFGLGIERFITWALARDDIKDAITYPRLKNIQSNP